MSYFSETGRRDNNEDAAWLSAERPWGVLGLVADGVGGHAFGEFASQMCVKHFREAFEILHHVQPDIPKLLESWGKAVAERLLRKGIENPEYAKCGTTLSGFWVYKEEYWTVNVGDSRVYHLLANGTLIRKTKDHSLVQELVDAGSLDPLQVFTHPLRNRLTSALGMPLSQVRIDVEGPFSIGTEETLLATTDGIHGAMTDEMLQEWLHTHKNEKNLAEALVKEAFSAGSKDNLTACAYFYDQKPKNHTP